MFVYEKDGQYDVTGQGTCSLFVQAVAQDLRDMPGFQHSDGDLGLSTLNMSDFLKQRIGTDNASKTFDPFLIFTIRRRHFLDVRHFNLANLNIEILCV